MIHIIAQLYDEVADGEEEGAHENPSRADERSEAGPPFRFS